jgi:hypothetical protein
MGVAPGQQTETEDRMATGAETKDPTRLGTTLLADGYLLGYPSDTYPT